MLGKGILQFPGEAIIWRASSVWSIQRAARLGGHVWGSHGQRGAGWFGDLVCCCRCCCSAGGSGWPRLLPAQLWQRAAGAAGAACLRKVAAHSSPGLVRHLWPFVAALICRRLSSGRYPRSPPGSAARPRQRQRAQRAARRYRWQTPHASWEGSSAWLKGRERIIDQSVPCSIATLVSWPWQQESSSRERGAHQASAPGWSGAGWEYPRHPAGSGAGRRWWGTAGWRPCTAEEEGLGRQMPREVSVSNLNDLCEPGVDMGMPSAAARQSSSKCSAAQHVKCAC